MTAKPTRMWWVAGAAGLVICAGAAATRAYAQGAPQASPANAGGAKSVVQAAVQAAGGAEKLAAVKDFVSRGQVTVQSPMGEVSGEMVAEVVYPDKTRSVLKLAMGEMVQAFDGQSGWMKMGTQAMDLPAALLPEVRRGIVTAGGISLLRKAANGEAAVSLLEPAEVNGRKADVISWKEGDLDMRLYFDAETHLLAKLAYRAASMQGTTDVEVLPSDFRDVSGLKIPFKVQTTQNGQKYLEMVATEMKVNAGVDAAAFSKPAP